MEKPRIAAKQPEVLTLEAGTYYWCQCGRSRDQPFCDGSHEGTGFEPVEFIVDETKEAPCASANRRRPRSSAMHAPDALTGRSKSPPSPFSHRSVAQR